MDLDLARVASPDSLLAMIAPAGDVDPMRCWLMGETLLNDGLFKHATGRRDEALDALARARVLFAPDRRRRPVAPPWSPPIRSREDVRPSAPTTTTDAAKTTTRSLSQSSSCMVVYASGDPSSTLSPRLLPARVDRFSRAL